MNGPVDLPSMWSSFFRESPSVLMLVVDSNGIVTESNAAAKDHLGADLDGRGMEDLLLSFGHNSDGSGPVCKWRQESRLTFQIPGGLPETFDVFQHNIGGSTYLLATVNLSEHRRMASTMSGLNRDLNNTTRMLHQANAELTRLNLLKNQFIGMAAHDLRKPLGVVMAYIEFVLDEAEKALADEHRGFLHTSLAAASAMKRLIDNFLDVSVIESGSLRLFKQQIKVSEVMDGVLPHIILIAGRKGVGFRVVGDQLDSTFVADKDKMQQVLLNILSNAVEHSPKGCEVVLRIALGSDGVVFEVTDSGPGLSSEQRERLFEPFSSVGTRKTAGERSTGLGLAISRRVVDAHRGRLWVESAVGAGSSFFVALPLE